MHYKRFGRAKRFTVRPLKGWLVTTSSGSPVFYASGRVVNTMSAAYTGEGKTGE
jgi:hypothetical protein